MQRDDMVEVVGVLTADEARELQRELDRRRDDALWFDVHRDAILQAHPERWIAVYQKRIVTSSETLRDLLTQLDASDAPRERAFIEFVSSEEIDLIVCGA